VFRVLGLFFTYLGLYLMNGHGQPALLYLVPCTLGSYFCAFDYKSKCYYRLACLTLNYCKIKLTGVAVVLGCIRGELKILWNYSADSSSLREPSDV
jgi:signal peptide peptidase-like protein 2B